MAPAPEQGMTGKVRMTALIVSHNEGHLIGDRLRELSFCDELIVVDVASDDDTAQVAEANGARVIPHPFVRVSDLVHPNVMDAPRNDFVVVPDPDEAISPALARQIADLPETLEDDVGIVIVPRIYYFRGKPLRGTIWGGTTGKRLVVRRSGAAFTGAVHQGIQVRSGFRIVHIDYDGTNALHHLWATSYRDFVAKHARYVRIEGAARAQMGEITGYRALIRTPGQSFRMSYWQRKGYVDGLRGLLLSVLYAAYRTGSDLSLIRELRRSNGRV
jgi:glycosyltransferase involved in cell wall biosynthesis